MDNDNNTRWLTVREFAKERGISTGTVYRWMRMGMFDDVFKVPGEPFVLPDTYLLVDRPRRERMATYHKKEKPPKRIPFHRRPPPSNFDEARERFNWHRSGNRIKGSLSFDELKELLIDKEMSMLEVAKLAGVSRQAISLMWNKYFAPFLTDGWGRQKEIYKRKRIKKVEEHFLSIEKLSRLTEIITDLGMDVEPIISRKNGFRCHSSRVRINGKLCGIYHLDKPAWINNEHSQRSYYRTNLSRAYISTLDFLIIFVGDDLKSAFVIPPTVLLGKMSLNGHHLIAFYIPSENLPAYNNQSSRIDWFSYENNWDQLRETPNDG
jgi:transcriptional regulator with XRE-family HTH domain